MVKIREEEALHDICPFFDNNQQMAVLLHMFGKNSIKGLFVAPDINIAHAPGLHGSLNHIFKAGFAMKIHIGLKLGANQLCTACACSYEYNFLLQLFSLLT
jgi:hypothetical protein